jgi:hypothetical protein
VHAVECRGQVNQLDRTYLNGCIPTTPPAAPAAATTLAALIPCAVSEAAITQTHLAFTGDTSTSMAVTFKEDAAVAGTTGMAYARLAGGSGGAAACVVSPTPADCLPLPLTRNDAQAVAGTGPFFTFYTGTFTGLTRRAGRHPDPDPAGPDPLHVGAR